MDILKYEVSVKNRLLPFVAAKEIADILNDIEDGSVQQEDVNAVFGNPKTLTGEIKKGKRKNFDYIVEIVLVLSIMIMTYIYLYRLPLWLFTTITSLELVFLFIEITKDYLVPRQSGILVWERKLFFAIEGMMIVIGSAFVIFMLLLQKFYDSYKDTLHIGKSISILSYAVIGIAIAVLMYSLYMYFIGCKLYYGGMAIQSAIYISMTKSFLSRVGNIESEDSVYVGNCVTAVLIASIIAIGYYYWRIKLEKTVREGRLFRQADI